MGFITCVGATDSSLSLLPEVGEMTPLGRGGPVSQVPEE